MYYIVLLRNIYYVSRIYVTEQKDISDKWPWAWPVFYYLWSDLQTTSLTDVIYICFDRCTTVLTRGSLCQVAVATFHELFYLWNHLYIYGILSKSAYKLLYFVDFLGYFDTFIFSYISCTTWCNTKLRFVRLKVLCIVIFFYVHNYLILFFCYCACHENLLY